MYFKSIILNYKQCFVAIKPLALIDRTKDISMHKNTVDIAACSPILLVNNQRVYNKYVPKYEKCSWILKGIDINSGSHSEIFVHV